MSDEIDLFASLAGKGAKTESSARKSGKFNASIIATYNCYLPFYENLVLRRLLASGCQYNVLLMDSRQLTESLEAPTLRPRLAGQSYSLVPIRAPGAFHPKLAILVGKQHVRLLVGSHNVTLSGFGRNRELSTQIDILRGEEDPNAPMAMAVWRFVEDWLRVQTEFLPRPVIDAVLQVASRFAPWLMNDSDQKGTVRFLGSSPKGPSLWESVRPYITKRPSRIVILGPFFDHKFDFIRTIRDDVEMDDIVIGVEPDKVFMKSVKARPDGVRFVDVSRIGRGEGYLHAKAIFAEFKGGRSLLVTGSANPSQPAWTKSVVRRNAEAVLIHTGPDARSLAEKIDIAKIPSMPELDQETWNSIQLRMDKEKSAPEGPAKPLLAVAVADEDVIVVQTSEVNCDSAVCLQQDDSSQLVRSVDIEKVDGGLRIRFPETDLSLARFIELRESDRVLVRALVHHPMAIASLNRTSTQQRFREALDSLGREGSDIATLIRLAETMIFDADDVESHVSAHRGRLGGKDKEQAIEDDTPIKSLIVESRATRKKRRRMRELSAGDLGYIIDTLIYRLGVGLYSPVEQLEARGPSEEEQIGADDDVQAPEEIQGGDLVRVCHGKVRTVVSRMLKQLERAHGRQVPPAGAIRQLLAVLALLRELRRQDPRLASITGGQSLVPVLQQERLIDGALEKLFERQKGLYVEAMRSLGDDPDGDLPRLRGLLLWLAWDAGLDARREPEENEDDDEEGVIPFFERAQLATLLPLVVSDPAAVQEACASILIESGDVREVEARHWLDAHLRWGEAILERYRNRHKWPKGSHGVAPGSLALATRERTQRLRLLIGRQGETVRLVDIGEDTGYVGFTLESVSFTEIPVCG